MAAVDIHQESEVELGGKRRCSNGFGGWGLKGLLQPTSVVASASAFDAWLVAAAGQIGQVLVTLPYTMAQMGIALGVVAFILYGALGAWTVYLLVWLYLEHKARYAADGKVQPERHILQYHEIITGLTGKLGGNITYFFIVFTMFLICIVQLVASSSDLYYANDNLNKREWQYIVGAVAFLTVFVPDFKHFRLGSLIGVLTTSITSVYMLIAAISQGQGAGVTHSGVADKVEFFTGATVILSAFGGHGITIEILESMKRPASYKWVCIAVTVYALLVTVPSAIAVYWSAGDILLVRSNAFAVLPPSGWRTMAVASLVIHQAAGFVLFSHPVFLLCEKAVGVHTKAFFLRILARIPVVAAMCFFALLLPFFGPINSIIGAFGVAIGMYIIPSVAFLFTYRSSFARQVRPHPCHRISTLTLSISPMSVLAYHARKTQTRPSK